MENQIKREHATSIVMTKGAAPIGLELIGSGNTCLVYRTEHNDIIKEFSPVVGGRVTMSRKQSANGPLTPIEGLSALDRSIVEDRLQSFTQEYSLVKELDREYQQLNDNMFLIPEQKLDTSLGLCHWCRYTGGNTLLEVFREYRAQAKTFQDYLEMVLPLVITLFDELAFYHGRDILNLDVKPDNLFAIKFNGKYIGIRNLDFGSARRAGEMICEIRAYARSHAQLPYSVQMLQISSKFFASSMPYYDEDRINTVIRYCLDGQASDAQIAQMLKLLDILAAWKVLLYALCGEVPIRSSTVCESDAVYEQFMSLCRNHRLSESKFSFENYNVFFALYRIMGRSFKGKLQYKLSAAEIRDGLADVLCVLQGIDQNSQTPRQMLADVKNRALARNEALLARYGLSSISDILQFWETNTGIPHPPSAQDLLWFLRYGCTHRAVLGGVRATGVGEQVDPALFADIVCKQVRYSVYDLPGNDVPQIEDAPLIRLWQTLKNGENLLVTGRAGAGKSTAMRVLEAELIHQEIPNFYYDCRDIGKDDLPEIGNELEGTLPLVYLFDGIEELSGELEAELMARVCGLALRGHRLVISARDGAALAVLREYGFAMAELQALTPTAVQGALQGQSACRELKELLQSPMMVKLYMEEKEGSVQKSVLVGKYFSRLLRSKGSDLPAEWIAQSIGARLLGRGRNLPVCLPRALRGVFVQTDDAIGVAGNLPEYESYCMAVYLAGYTLEYPELVSVDTLTRLLDLNADRGNCPLTDEQIAAVCAYTSELLAALPESKRSHVMQTLEKVATAEMAVTVEPAVRVAKKAAQLLLQTTEMS